MKQDVIEWKLFLTYAPVSNGRAERMIGTLKNAVAKMVRSADLSLYSSLSSTLSGYRRRRGRTGVSPF